MLKRVLFVSALAVTAPFFPAFVGDGAVAMAQTKSIALERKLRQARECYDHGNYAAALERAEAALKTAPHNSEALYIKTQASELLAEQREREKAMLKERELTAYNSACAVATAEALNAFIKDYPNSEYVNDVRRRLEDLGLWDVAQKSNTREAYEKYIASSHLGAFADDARKRIDQFEEQERERQRQIEEEQRRQRMEAEWNSIAVSFEKNRLEAFLKEFPNSPHENEARLHVSLARAEESYTKDMLADAVKYYKEAEKYGSFTGGSYAAHYADAQSRLKYKQMLTSTNRTDVFAYLSSMEMSNPYYNDVSNHYAMLLAEELSNTSTQRDFDKVLAFTRDSATRTAVNQRINYLRQQQRVQERAERAATRHEKWKGRVKMGWEMMEVAGAFDEDEYGGIATSTKLLCRLGRYTDTLNFLVGLGYRYVADFDFEDGDSETLAHQLTASVKMRLNMGRRSRATRFFVGGGFETGTSVAGDCGNPLFMDWIAEMGFVGNHCDFSFFYKRCLEDKEMIDHFGKTQMGGIALSIYF